MEIKDRIQEKARDLFMRLGIRSVSMDDIATQLGMSKKTIYQFFADKDELVEGVMADNIRQTQQDCERCLLSSANAIEEIFLTMEMIQEQFRNMNPMILYDLQKFHIGAFQKLAAHKNEFLLSIIRNNIEKGISEGLYRKDINVDILSKFRLESMMMAFNLDLFPPAKYSLADVTQVIIEHFLFGLATIEGHELILKYQKERSKKEKYA
jgi:TetR/AcrR family transcriptional regulator, cholesterol catabolism regulator